MLINNKKILFNFSSSYTGGGLKRLISFSEWFDSRGGAIFIVHEKSKVHLLTYKNNTYFYINLSKFKKVLNSHKYLIDIVNSIGVPYMYYSYSVPIPFKVGSINWFHLSNVLPLISHSGYGLSLFRSIELKWLGKLFKKSYKNAQVLSAESDYSLNLLPSSSKYVGIVSPNGSDKEIELFGQSREHKVNNIAVIVGTFFYKDLKASYRVFLKLKEKHKELKMVIVGISSMIPSEIASDKSIVVTGEIRHEEVIILLSAAKFYINTSKFENSWNSASEGVLLANESYISRIEPHFELVKTIANNNYVFDGDLIHVKRKNISVEKLMDWSDIIQNMIKLGKTL
jgi:hypothetical protein